MKTWTYTVTEYDPDKPWLVLGVRKQMRIELEGGQIFAEWAAQEYPRERFSAQLDPPYQL